MVILLAGASHCGKTYLAQQMLEKYRFPYLSIDHLKMGLIRSCMTDLTPMDDDKLTDYLWPIVREMVKTAIENHQNLIVEGCYIPFDWESDFTEEYLQHIRYRCLIMTPQYIADHFADIKAFGSVIEKRVDDSGLCKENLMEENESNLQQCKKFGLEYILIEDSFPTNLSQINL